MPLGFTYWSDVTGTQLADDAGHQWVHALPIGEYDHPIYGKLKFTPERIRKFADSVTLKVRGIDPDIDYDHKLDSSKGKKAAGWVKGAEARDDGLWLFVEWTPEAASSIHSKEYRYFSAEFANEWEDGKGNKFTDVVLGGGLTNRPFVKDLVPINFSEVMDDTSNKENEMDRKQLIKLLSLSDDATDEQIEQAIKDKGSSPDLSEYTVTVDKDGKVTAKDKDGKEVDIGVSKVDLPKAEGKEGEGGQGEGKGEEAAAQAELAALAEKNPAVAKMLTEHQALKEDVTTLKTATRLSEVTTQLSELGKDHKRVLPPVVQNKLREVMVQLPKQLSDDLADAMVELMKVGTVELGERTANGKDGTKGSGDGSAVTQFLSEVDRIQKQHKEEHDEKLSFRDAVDEVCLNDPALYERYQDAVNEGATLTEQ